MTFLDVWIGYAIFGTAVFSAMFVWAVRNRQFSDLDRARRIALEARTIEPDHDYRETSRSDRCGLIALLLIVLATLGSVIWVGIRNM